LVQQLVYETNLGIIDSLCCCFDEYWCKQPAALLAAGLKHFPPWLYLHWMRAEMLHYQLLLQLADLP